MITKTLFVEEGTEIAGEITQADAWQTYVALQPAAGGKPYFALVATGEAYDNSDEARKATLTSARQYARILYGDRLA